MTQRGRQEEGIWDTIKVVIQALLIAFVIRTFLFQPFNIPSGSMYPTLKIGDYLFVSKLSYGYGKYSFNFTIPGIGLKFGPMPFDGRVVMAETPERGDVVVFKLPSDKETDYIKRVIGLPGERIQVRDGVLFINGQAVKREPVAPFVDPQGEGHGLPVPQIRETLPNGVSYETLDAQPRSAGDNTEEFLVPAGHYFMMGDNRDNSLDSRFQVGFVPYENLVGRAEVIFFSFDVNTRLWEIWKVPFAIRWNRLLNWVD
ncbi:MAG: signal peptidase I [Aestuariivirgaceae bacterium]|nr:signal peptidase I [Aestuariivirgaceae bacterium]